jgi:hypothetical protein
LWQKPLVAKSLVGRPGLPASQPAGRLDPAAWPMYSSDFKQAWEEREREGWMIVKCNKCSHFEKDYGRFNLEGNSCSQKCGGKFIDWMPSATNIDPLNEVEKEPARAKAAAKAKAGK